MVGQAIGAMVDQGKELVDNISSAYNDNPVVDELKKACRCRCHGGR